MVSKGLQKLGIALAVIGWIGVIVVCVLPMWRITTFIGANIIWAQIIWEGLWMNCVIHSTGEMQCKVYDSLLALPQDLQVGRALTVVSILVGVVGLLLVGVGGKCTNCIEDERAKAKVGVVAGIIFIVAGLLCLIPVCWTANTILSDFYNPLTVSAQKRDLGASLYFGWAASALLIIGGTLFCASCPPKNQYSAKYTAQP